MRERDGRFHGDGEPRAKMSESQLEVRDVRKAYDGHVAVDDVSFAVPPGSVFGLLGPNGAGKTTTIRMIIDILAPDRGEVLPLRARRAAPRTSGGSATCPRSAASTAR